MNLEKMSYKNYVWSHNPKEIVIEEEKNIKEFLLPFSTNVLQNFGRKKRVVKGVGEFFGDACLEDFNELRGIYVNDDTGYLKLPNTEPFLAAFKLLKMSGVGSQNVITYTFEFWEKIEQNLNKANFKNKYYTAIDGETLWNIAYKCDMTVNELARLNPQIKRPDSLKGGQRVVLD